MTFQIRFFSSEPGSLSVEVASMEYENVDLLAEHLSVHGFEMHYPDGKIKKILPGAILSVEEK